MCAHIAKFEIGESVEGDILIVTMLGHRSLHVLHNPAKHGSEVFFPATVAVENGGERVRLSIAPTVAGVEFNVYLTDEFISQQRIKAHNDRVERGREREREIDR